MNYPENLASAAEYLKKAIPHMMEQQLPANPINYTLWYNYVANHIPALNKALDRITTKTAGLTPEQSEELFFNYIISEHLEDHQQALKDITQIAAGLLSNLNNTMDGGEVFDKELSGHLEQLKAAKSMGEVSQIVDKVISSSEDIKASNQHFMESMQVANQEIASLRHQLQQAEKNAYTDQLTQLYNRHAFDRQLEQLLQTEAVAKNVCLILTDLDHFKSFNDDYGHIIGDRVLQRTGELIQDYSPDNAIGARYGGEEFAIIISNATIDETVAVAEKIRTKLQQLRVKIKNSDKVLDNISASFGVAQFIIGETAENFIDRADQALYSAKNNGRNQVAIYSDS
ncbi:GGDEF domain-containing protein [Oceanicoccus sagamiensis]|uniref:diguanylate cyclase n=1 Tax=Oceanicoccus sagamiensis TaxID=716816 RepID=A0A1X9N6B1_9GAMM|nr:GGDEF domain-containing protein [Oceanicoccus sagamiensis]ARN73256.1 hypothetical protein BST96_03520 [Oceanicoccus sagamiensis]